MRDDYKFDAQKSETGMWLWPKYEYRVYKDWNAKKVHFISGNFEIFWNLSFEDTGRFTSLGQQIFSGIMFDTVFHPFNFIIML